MTNAQTINVLATIVVVETLAIVFLAGLVALIAAGPDRVAAALARLRVLVARAAP